MVQFWDMLRRMMREVLLVGWETKNKRNLSSVGFCLFVVVVGLDNKENWTAVYREWKRLWGRNKSERSSR